MADQVITKQELIDAGLDAGSIETFVNGAAGIVTTRTGAQYPNLQAIVQNLADFAAAYQWSVDTTSVVIEDPTSGQFRFDNADPSLVTSIAVSANAFTGNGDDVSAYVATWGDSTSTIKGFINIRESANGTAFAIYSISSVTDNGTWLELTVSYVTGAGSFTDGNATYIAFARTGDKGADGAGVGDVVGPASSTDSAVALYDGATGKLLKDGPTIGTGANELVQLNGSGALPAVDGSNLTGIVSGGPSLGTDAIIRTNADVIVEDIVIPAGVNGMSAGPITFGNTNELLWSEDLTQSVWTDPLGQWTVLNINADNPFGVNQLISEVSAPADALVRYSPLAVDVGESYTFSVYVKLTSGTISKIEADQGDGTVVDLGAPTAEWSRISFTFVGNTNLNFDLQLYVSAAATLQIFGAQVVRGSNVVPYVKTTNAVTQASVTGPGTWTDTGKLLDGSAKAWANLNGTGTIAVRDSYNVSSVVDNGTGSYSFNFTNTFANADYMVANSVGGTSALLVSRTIDDVIPRTVSQISLAHQTTTTGPIDVANCEIVTHGDLA